jgi:cytochrome c553
MRAPLTSSVLLLTMATCLLTARELTFSEDAGTIMYKHCAGCHHPNDAAPMSLLSYAEIKPWAAAVREAVLLKTMAPWKADAHYGKWSNDASLSAQEISTIVNWIDQGKKEGDRKLLPPQPVFSTEWKIGKTGCHYLQPFSCQSRLDGM